MKVLLLNTCGAEGSIALADSELRTPIVAQVTLPGRTASERLVGVVRDALDRLKWRPCDLAAIAVVTGPGSFTGVRVGLSVAKGLGEASGVPLIAISRLAMLAAAAQSSDERVCVLLDAGRGEFYCGEYRDGAELSERLIAREGAFAAIAAADRTIICEASMLESFKRSDGLLTIDDPPAAGAYPLAMKRLTKRDFDDPMTLDANYLRRTDAEIFAKPAAALPGSL